MVFEGLALIEGHDVGVGELVLVPALFDGLARNLLAIHENPPIRALKEDAVVAAARDHHLDATGERAGDGEVFRRVVAVVHRWIAVLEWHGMLGVGTVDLRGALTLGVFLQRPLGDVDVVRAPVGELAAGVFVPPAKLVVAPPLAVVHLRRLAEPHLPVEFLRRLRDGERTSRRTAVDADRHLLDVAEQPLVDHVHRSQELILLAPLLRADEKLELRKLLRGGPGQPVFLERQRERLLAEHVLARLQRLDRDLHVPVVRRDDADNVDVVPVEHVAVIAVGVGLALARIVVVATPFRVAVVDVAHGHDVAELGVAVGITGAHGTGTDTADPRAIVGGSVGKRGRRPGERWHESPGQGGRSRKRARQKTPTRRTMRSGHTIHSVNGSINDEALNVSRRRCRDHPTTTGITGASSHAKADSGTATSEIASVSLAAFTELTDTTAGEVRSFWAPPPACAILVIHVSVFCPPGIRRLKDCPVVVDLHELGPVGRRATGGRDGRRFERFAKVCQGLPACLRMPYPASVERRSRVRRFRLRSLSSAASATA